MTERPLHEPPAPTAAAGRAGDSPLAHGDRYRRLVDEARARGPLRVAIAHPCDVHSMRAIAEGLAAGLIAPVLLGPQARLRAAAAQAGLDLSALDCQWQPHSHAAAARAVELAREHRVDAVMKGSLHTDELLGAVLDPATGLRTDRRVSHVYLMDLPAYPRPLLVTDAAVNIEPDLAAKRDICQNAIDLARWLGIERPKVAVLAAVETVNPRMRSTLDAAALSVMALRGQITGGVVEGPFAFDNAIDPAAARSKGLAGEVAGQADILLVPDIEAGNMVAKQLLYFAAADGAGIVLGARVPVILTSRSDGVRVRIASMALASLMAGRMRERAAEALVAAH
jgi:phosphate acetyltransferase